MADRQILFIVNGNSKNGYAMLERLTGVVPHGSLKWSETAEHTDQMIEQTMVETFCPTIVFCGGDGMVNHGYSKVYELQQKLGSRPTVTTLPAGNGNDHFCSIYGHRSLGEMLRVIQAGRIRPLDLIQIVTGETSRLAASYVSWGKSADLAAQLHLWQEHRRRLATEAGRRPRQWLVEELAVMARHLRPVRSFGAELGQGRKELLHLSIHSVRKMAKLLTPVPYADPSDSVLEMLRYQAGRGNTARFLYHIARAWAHRTNARALHPQIGLDFKLCNGGEPVEWQYDGEPDLMNDGQEVRVGCLPGALTTLAA